MARTLRRAGWEVFAFDSGADRWTGKWVDRDLGMAESFVSQFRGLPDGCKAIALCGGGHARLRPHPRHPEMWLSCAAHLTALLPGRRVRSADVCLHGGTFYNADRIRRLSSEPWPWADQAVQTTPCADGAYSLEIPLPIGSSATFVGFSGARLRPVQVRATLMDLGAEGPQLYVFGGIFLAADLGSGAQTFAYRTAKGGVVFHQTGPGCGARGDVLGVFASLHEAVRRARYAPDLLAQVAAAFEELDGQPIEGNPNLGGMPGSGATVLDV